MKRLCYLLTDTARLAAIVIACSMLDARIQAQTSGDLVPKINIPTSPEAAMIGRFGDIPVGYYTGTADLSIPLYSVVEGPVKLPITLQYHGSGIKVDDQATWVGLGWSLSPEGAIIQEVRGKSDEEDYGATCALYDYPLFMQRFANLQDNSYMFLPQWGRATATNSCLFTIISIPPPPYPWDNNYEDPYCIIDQLRRGIGQPDIYNYSFNGHSGKFYIHPVSKEIVVIEKTDQVYFQKVNNDLIKATTLDGTIFSFGAVEKANGGIVNEYTGKTYKISSIQLITGKSISFTYSDNKYTEQVVSHSAELNNFSQDPAVSISSSFTNHDKKTLTRITTSDAYIDFNLSSRDDINVDPADNLQKLSSIDIKSRLSGKKVKTFEFSYSYFPYSAVGVVFNSYISSHSDQFGKRLKLDSLREIGYDDTEQPVASKPAYRFEYDMSVTMPMKVSFAKDFWGYYNGVHNTILLPNLDYFDYFNEPDYQVINQTLSYPYTGADRYTDNTKAGAYMLKRIIYPTGGFTDFEYEPNSFTNQFIPDKSKNVFKQYSVQDHSLGGTSTQKFKLSRTVNIRFENRIYNGAGNPNGVTPLTYEQMLGCYISLSKMKTVNGNLVVTPVHQWGLDTTLIAEFQANNGRTWKGEIRVPYDPDPTVEYQIKVVFPDNLNNPLFLSIAGVTSSIKYYDNTGVDISESHQCGMRIRSVKNYSEAGALATHKQYNYYEGKLLNKFRPLTIYKANHLDVSYVDGGIGYQFTTFYKKITVSGSDFGTSGGNLIGYGKVEEIELVNGAPANGRKAFYYHNSMNNTHQGCPYIPWIGNGQVYKEEIYDNRNIKVLEKTTQYADLTAPLKYMGINVVKLSTGSKVPCNNHATFNPIMNVKLYDNLGADYNTSEYGYNAYTINARYRVPGKITTKEYEAGNVLTKTETYTYNFEGSVRSVTTNNSRGEELITRYYYPNDFMIDEIVDNHMSTRHNTGTPVITELYKGTVLLSRQKTVYGMFPNTGAMLPKYTYTQKGTNPEERRVTIDSYDDMGNMTQYTVEKEKPVSIVWNADKTLPVAKIENATYASLLALPGGLNADFRTLLPHARVTTYTYKPLTGVATVTDVNNKTSYYQYDAYGRLVVVKDMDGNIIKTYDYHYKQ